MHVCSRRSALAAHPIPRYLLASVDEATDLGQNERERIAWATARYWRTALDGS